jgi:hypothetical protein
MVCQSVRGVNRHKIDSFDTIKAPEAFILKQYLKFADF